MGLITQQCYQEGIFHIVSLVSCTVSPCDCQMFAATLESEGRETERVCSSPLFYQGIKPFLQALNQLLLTLHWSSWGHMPPPRTITGKGEWVHHDWMKPVITYPVCWAFFPEQNWGLLAGKKGKGILSGASRCLSWTKEYRTSACLSYPVPLFTSQLALGTPTSGHPSSASSTPPMGSSWPELSCIFKQARYRK